MRRRRSYKKSAECQTRFNSGQIQIYEMDMSTYLPKYYYTGLPENSHANFLQE